jgi:hypothetical protein
MQLNEAPAESTSKKSHKNQRKHWLDYATFGVESLGFVGLCIYASLTWGIFRANRATVVEMQRQTRIDERPWVAFSAPDSFDLISGRPIAFAPGKKLQVPIVFTNYGKTAARKNQLAVSTTILPLGEEPALPDDSQMLTPLGASGPPGEHVVAVYPMSMLSIGSVAPSETVNLFVSRPKFNGGQALDDPLTQDEAARLAQGQAYIAVWGRFSYSDIFGIQHETRFCRAIPRAATLPKCANYNDVDGEDGTITSKPHAISFTAGKNPG